MARWSKIAFEEDKMPQKPLSQTDMRSFLPPISETSKRAKKQKLLSSLLNGGTYRLRFASFPSRFCGTLRSSSPNFATSTYRGAPLIMGCQTWFKSMGPIGIGGGTAKRWHDHWWHVQTVVRYPKCHAFSTSAEAYLGSPRKEQESQIVLLSDRPCNSVRKC